MGKLKEADDKRKKQRALKRMGGSTCASRGEHVCLCVCGCVECMLCCVCVCMHVSTLCVCMP